MLKVKQPNRLSDFDSAKGFGDKLTAAFSLGGKLTEREAEALDDMLADFDRWGMCMYIDQHGFRFMVFGS